MTFYPGYKSVEIYPKWRTLKDCTDCPICKKGKRVDAKTGIERNCLACKGTGKIKKAR